MEPLETISAPTASRPMLGMTILVVEDSIYASEALRLLCLRSGARIRRADCLASARRHLAVYRPSALIVDLGLPDGSGADLIAQISRATPKVSVVAALSGDTGMEQVALEAGADCFLEKPMTSIAQFQSAILAHMPPEYRQLGLRALSDEQVEPDQVAYLDDMSHAQELLKDASEDSVLAYLGQFLTGVARCAGDGALLGVAERVEGLRRDGRPLGKELDQLGSMLRERVDKRMAI